MNKVVKLDAHPLRSLAGKHFSKLDLTARYCQINLTEASKPKIAILMLGAHFEFNVLLFGLATSAACFEIMMEKVLGECVGIDVFVYLDDILVATDTASHYLVVIHEVFDKMRMANFKFKPHKREPFH